MTEQPESSEEATDPKKNLETPPPQIRPANQHASVKQLYVFVILFLVILFGTFLILLFVDIDESTGRFQALLFITRLICSLVVGALVALIPGALEIDWAKSLGIRATGAAAAFVLIWTVNPPSMIKEGVDRIKFSEVLVRCQNGFGDRSPPDTSARSNCPLLVKLDPQRWEGYYYQGKLDYWDNDFINAVFRGDQASERLDGLSQEELIAVSVRINNLQNYARLSLRTLDALREVVAANQKLLTLDLPNGVSPELYLQSVIAILDLEAASITGDDLTLARASIEALSNKIPGTQHWIDYHLACLHLLEYETTGEADALREGYEALRKAAVGMNSYMENLAPIQTRMMLCRLVQDSSECEYRGGDPVLCRYTRNLPQDQLLELREVLG